MKLSEILSPELILPSLEGTDAKGVLSEFADAICKCGKFSSPQTLLDRLYEREVQESTGIGNGLAIPHCKIESLTELVLAIGYSEKGVDFNALDGKPTYYFFLVISPAGAAVLHLRTL